MPSKEKVEEKKESNIDNALNTPGFLAFLEKYPDSKDFEPNDANAEELEKRFTAFKKKGAVEKNLITFFQDRFEKETGVRLQKGEFKELADELEVKIIENPGIVETLSRDMESYSEGQQEIKGQEAKLTTLAPGEGEMSGKKDMLRLLHESFKERGVARKLVASMGFGLSRDEQATMKKFNVGGASAGKRLETIEDAEEAKKSFQYEASRLREGIFEEFQATKTLHALVMEKLKERTGKLMGKEQGLAGSKENLKEIFEYATKLKGSSEDEPSFDYLEEGLSEAGVSSQEFEERLDQLVALRVAADLEEAAERSVSASQPLANLELKLDSYLKEKQLGSRQKEDIRELITESAQAIISRTTDAKRLILLRRIVIKYNE